MSGIKSIELIYYLPTRIYAMFIPFASQTP